MNIELRLLVAHCTLYIVNYMITDDGLTTPEEVETEMERFTEYLTRIVNISKASTLKITG